MDENQPRVVIDTNVLASAIAFGGKPERILTLVLEEKIQAVTSAILLAELEEILSKKLLLSQYDIQFTLEEIRDEFSIVQPKIPIKASRDKDDNRVLEAAVEGRCDYVITGDRDLLDLKMYRGIKIVTPNDFLDVVEKT